MDLPSKKYPTRRKKAFERIIGQLLARAGEMAPGSSRQDILKILEGKSISIQTKWGKAALPELMPLLKKESWSPDRVRDWFTKYRKRVLRQQKRKRNRHIAYLIEYFAHASDRLIDDAEDACRLLESLRRGPDFLLFIGTGTEPREIDAETALRLFGQLTVEEKTKVIRYANIRLKKRDKELRDELIDSGLLHRLKCECCNEVIRCPTCTNDMLRSWGAGKDTISLCYECGTLFKCSTGGIISQFDGNPLTWGARALAEISRNIHV